MTKPSRCAWCSSQLPPAAGQGRPRRYCKRACRQRDFEARRRARELGLVESELVIERRALDALDDLLYVFELAVADVDVDLALGPSAEEVRRSLDWLLEAGRPLVGAGRRLRV